VYPFLFLFGRSTVAKQLIGGYTTCIPKHHFIAPLKGEQTILEPSQRFQVHPNQIVEWKKQLLEHSAEVFNKGKTVELALNVKDLHAKIGQLSMENDCLSNALGRIDGAGAKK